LIFLYKLNHTKEPFGFFHFTEIEINLIDDIPQLIQIHIEAFLKFIGGIEIDYMDHHVMFLLSNL